MYSTGKIQKPQLKQLIRKQIKNTKEIATQKLLTSPQISLPQTGNIYPSKVFKGIQVSEHETTQNKCFENV